MIRKIIKESPNDGESKDLENKDSVEKTEQKADTSTTEKSDEKTNEVKKEPALVYIGASLPKGALQQFAVFNNGLPGSLNAHIKKCPALKTLIVPVTELAEARKNLNIPGTVEHTLNFEIQKYVRGGK